MGKYISEAVIRRLPQYYRKLQELQAKGIERISSHQLGIEMDLNASQIRRDFNCFGGFGQQGYGYHVERLLGALGEILGLANVYRAIIVGAGNIGHALVRYREFAKQQVAFQGIFDASPKLIGMKAGDLVIQDVMDAPAFIQENQIVLGCICTPPGPAQQVCDMLVEAGVRGIWNFAQTELVHPAHVSVENVHLSDSLLTLTYHLNEHTWNTAE